MVKDFEREQAVVRKKAEDENKSALLRQAEEKRRMKDLENKKELERERKEDEQIRKERESIRLRDQKEVENERGGGGGGEKDSSKSNLQKSNLFKAESPTDQRKSSKIDYSDNSPNKIKMMKNSKNNNLFDIDQSPQINSENFLSPSQKINRNKNSNDYNNDYYDYNDNDNDDSSLSLKELRSKQKNKNENMNNSADFDKYNNSQFDKLHNRNSEIIRELENAKIGMNYCFFYSI